MADEDVSEENPGAASEAEGGDTGTEADAAVPSGRSVEEPANQAVNGKDSLTPNRAAKIAGIVIGAVLVCAVVVVAAVWAIAAIVDDNDDEPWFEYVSPSALEDDHYDAYEHGYGKRPPADSSRYWPSKDHFAKPGFGTKDGACGPPFGFDGCEGPVVVLVVPGLGPRRLGQPRRFRLRRTRGRTARPAAVHAPVSRERGLAG